MATIQYYLSFFFDKIENFSAFYFMRLLESLHCKPIFLDLGVIIVSADPNDFNSNAQDEEQNT